MQQITHPNNPRPTSPPHAVNPASRLIIQINFCRAQDADPDPDPFCSFYFKDGRRSSRWVGGWVHCRRPLARPRAQATKKTQARIWSWPKLFSSSRQAPRAQIFSNFGQGCCPSQILSNSRQGCCPSQIYPPTAGSVPLYLGTAVHTRVWTVTRNFPGYQGWFVSGLVTRVPANTYPGYEYTHRYIKTMDCCDLNCHFRFFENVK